MDEEVRRKSKRRVKKGTHQEFRNEKVIIANSGLNISFARADYLYLLKETVKVKELIIPNAVFVVKGRGKPGAEELKEAVWIKRKEAKDKNKVENFLFLESVGE